eukprot:scaffold16857_cov22-Cyclotella_meneghiniana.AAC.3
MEYSSSPRPRLAIEWSESGQLQLHQAVPLSHTHTYSYWCCIGIGVRTALQISLLQHPNK